MWMDIKMKENKFRAFFKETGDMIYFGNLKPNETESTLNCHSLGEKVNGHHGLPGRYAFEEDIQDDLEIMQYIALKDKNKKELYEDDIVKYNEPTPIGAHYVYGVVVSKNGCFVIDHINKKYNHNILWWTEDIVKNHLHQDLKIVGNIWENKDLLK